MSQFPVHDLHCDLLCYLAGDPTRTPFDPIVRCSIPDLKKGGVEFQVLAVFSETAAGSSQKGEDQIKLFSKLKQTFDPTIKIQAAIENGSCFAEETEPLNQALIRLDRWQKDFGPIFYISLTWNFENRFGGGALTNIGLKEDGKQLLAHLHGKKIAVDLSHTSDALAYDILNYIDSHKLAIPILASHSNFRTICNAPRNLPDELALEVIRRKGLIGINFVQPFIGPDTPSNFVKHLEYGLKLGGENALCFGADFFHDEDIPAAHRKNRDYYFFKDYGNSSVYPQVIALWTNQLALSESILDKIVSKNILDFQNENQGCINTLADHTDLTF